MFQHQKKKPFGGVCFSVFWLKINQGGGTQSFFFLRDIFLWPWHSIFEICHLPFFDVTCIFLRIVTVFLWCQGQKCQGHKPKNDHIGVFFNFEYLECHGLFYQNSLRALFLCHGHFFQKCHGHQNVTGKKKHWRDLRCHFLYIFAMSNLLWKIMI